MKKHCFECGSTMDKKGDVFCGACIQGLNEKIADLENEVYELEKSIRKRKTKRSNKGGK